MRGLLLNAYLVCLVPFAWGSPYIGLYIYYWLSYFDPFHLAYAPMPVPWVKIFAAITIVAWLLSKEPKRIPFNMTTTMLVVFYAWTTITLIFGLFPQYGLPKWQDFTSAIVMVFVALGVLTRRHRIHGALWVVVLALGWWTFKGGLFVLLSAGAQHVYGPEGTHFADNNGMARACIMIMPLILYLFLYSSQKHVRYALLGLLGLTILALVGTNSRGGFLGFGAMAAFAWLFARRKIVPLAIAVVIVGLGYLATPKDRIVEYTQRIESTADYENDGSAQGRFGSWRYAVELASRRPLGGGFGAFHGHTAPGQTSYTEAHSNYFEVIGEHGFIGLAIYLTIVIAAYRTCSRIIRMTKPRPDLHWARDLARCLQACEIAYLVGGLTINHATLELWYMLVAFMVATGTVVRRELARETAEVARERPALPGVVAGAGPMRWHGAETASRRS
ncbi:MAG TPA: putative O-glycosylation ligase, exosortase A system-associated [Stellaceae bacterium]|nr:putative O-glycosylation ligase, exosortase A system-associated [Stellaceae bacterium]